MSVSSLLVYGLLMAPQKTASQVILEAIKSDHRAIIATTKTGASL
jgi:hypothetical protein